MLEIVELGRRGRQIKFTPERIEQIKNLVERGKSREEIAELIGVTLGRCKSRARAWESACGRPSSTTGFGRGLSRCPRRYLSQRKPRRWHASASSCGIGARNERPNCRSHRT